MIEVTKTKEAARASYRRELEAQIRERKAEQERYKAKHEAEEAVWERIHWSEATVYA